MSTVLVQAKGLQINEVSDGFVVYEENSDRVHYLNHTAAVVFTLADGVTTVDEIALLMASTYQMPEPPLAELLECIRQMRSEGLLQ